ncbi:MAG: Spy/CpxP family protein refolding chaperone [Desulfomonilaceae bacterium]
MKKAILVGSLVTAVFAVILLAHAAEQQQPQPQQEAKEEGAPAMRMNPQMMQKMMETMQQAGIDPEMMRRCKAVMSAPIFLDSPAVIRGQAESLELSDEQKQKLLDIEKEAREKARTVLTEEQTKKLGEIPDKPVTMMEMCQQMCGKMMPMMKKMMGGGPQDNPMMCPMMQMMMGGKNTPQGSEPKKDK